MAPGELTESPIAGAAPVPAGSDGPAAIPTISGRVSEAREILVQWAGAVSEGMLPNRFPDHGEQPEYNSVDASLWYVVAAGELLQLADAAEHSAPILGTSHRRALENAVAAIVAGYAAGTRFGIKMEDDALLAAGVRAVVVCVDPARVPPACVGRAWDAELLAELPDGVDPCGENGEVHTLVTDGPFTLVVDTADLAGPRRG